MVITPDDVGLKSQGIVWSDVDNVSLFAHNARSRVFTQVQIKLTDQAIEQGRRRTRSTGGHGGWSTVDHFGRVVIPYVDADLVKLAEAFLRYAPSTVRIR